MSLTTVAFCLIISQLWLNVQLSRPHNSVLHLHDFRNKYKLYYVMLATTAGLNHSHAIDHVTLLVIEHLFVYRQPVSQV